MVYLSLARKSVFCYHGVPSNELITGHRYWLCQCKLALISENGGVVEFDTGETGSSPRIAVSLIIARLREIFSLEEIVAAGVLDFGRDIIPKDLFGRNIVADGNCI